MGIMCDCWMASLRWLQIVFFFFSFSFCMWSRNVIGFVNCSHAILWVIITTSKQYQHMNANDFSKVRKNAMPYHDMFPFHSMMNPFSRVNWWVPVCIFFLFVILMFWLLLFLCKGLIEFYEWGKKINVYVVLIYWLLNFITISSSKK